MQKITNLLLSATLVASSALTLSAAAPQQALKASAGINGAAVTRTVTVRTAPDKSKALRSIPAISLPKHRTHATNFIEKAKTVATPRYKTAQARLPQADLTGVPAMRGLSIYSDLMTEEDSPVFCTIPTSASEDFTPVFETPDVFSAMFAVQQDGNLYVHEAIEIWGMYLITLYAYDIESGQKIGQEYLDYDGMGTCAAVDPVTNTVYAVNYYIDEDEDIVEVYLSKLHYEGVQMTCDFIAPVDRTYNVIAFDAAGQLYGVDDEGILCKIDKTTAVATEVGPTGLEPYYYSSATIDPRTNRMFYAICDAHDDGLLTEVDLATGAASLVYHFPANNEVIGLDTYFIAAPDAPAAATDLKVDFPEGGLSGTVSFKAPATTFDGTQASGTISYALSIDGQQAASGQAAYGENVTVDVTVDQPGVHSFTVVFSNGNGDGPKASATGFAGFGTAAAPANVVASAAAANVTISWDAVTASANGGFINPSQITYNVVRNDGKEVAKGISATSCTDQIDASGDDIASFFYYVYAVFEGNISEAGVSNSVVFGNTALPWSVDFANVANLSEFVIVDANNDGITWELKAGYISVLYNTNEDMDDWLFCPPMKLETGKSYIVEFKAAANSSVFPEQLEVKYGNAPTAAAMTQTVCEPIVLRTPDATPFEYAITPSQSGTYYIGFHGISEADQYALKLYEISVSAPLSPDCPAQISDFEAKAAAAFSLDINLTLTAPDKTLSGAALQSIDRIEITRDGQIVKTFQSPAPGQALSCSETAPAEGTYTYTAISYNAAGQSQSATASVYVGATLPGAIEFVGIEETETLGTVKVWWDAVTVDADGAPLPADKVTYTVINDDGFVVADNVTETSVTLLVCQPSEQTFTQFAVVAETSKGLGEGVYSELIPVGAPYTSFYESFANGNPETALAIATNDEFVTWNLADDETFTDVKSADGDSGYLYLKGEYIDDEGSIYTGKVLVPQDAPAFSFSTFSLGENDTNIVAIKVRENFNDEFTTIFEGNHTEMSEGNIGWVQKNISLDAYAGKVVQFEIQAIIKAYAIIPFDCFKVVQLLDKDLAISNIAAPANVNPGEDFVVDVTVSNLGGKTADSYSIDLYVDGEKADNFLADNLASGESFTATFGLTMPALAVEPLEIYAEVVFDGDLLADNNKSKTVTVAPVLPKLPYVTDLSGKAEDGKAVLTWTKPAAGATVESGEVDFEDGDSFAFEYAGWTFVDVDQSPVGGFQNLDIPGIDVGTSTASFIVFDASGDEFNAYFDAHSGNMYLASFFRYDDGTVDDWAISPELTGNAQTVTFFAKSYSAQYAEAIEMYYSTGSLNPADFIQVGTKVAPVPGDWTEYSFDVPDGAKHFAIRSCATSSFMLMLDDFTFQAADAKSLVIEGYNIYRDGVKVNEAPVADTTYTDDVEPGTYTYVVTVVFEEKGESRPSDAVEVNVEASGLDSISGKLSISSADASVIVSGAKDKPVAISTVDGKVIFATAAAGDKLIVPAAKGIYIVKAGKTVAKVIVR